MRKNKIFNLAALLFSLVILNGCSAVMAGKRSSYKGNPKVLMIGQSRMVVESELGAPDLSTTLEGGKKKVIYKMDPDAHTQGAKTAAVAGHIVADVLTLGLWEIAGTPTEIAAQDKMKNYVVIYNSNDIIESVECN